MTSRSSSRSEGEILSSDSEKATTSLPPHNGISVDRLVRPSASAPRSPAARPHLSRSRSRSPRQTSGREKRRREDEYSRERTRHESRTFNVRYEDDRNDRTHRRPPSYEDADHNRTRQSYLRYDDDDDRRRSSKRPRTRSRSRSRSPYRHGQPAEQQRASSRAEKVRNGDDRYRKGDSSRGARSNENWMKPSVSERSSALRVAHSSESRTETSYKQNFQGAASQITGSLLAKNTNGGIVGKSIASEEPLVASLQMTDEAAAIEQRRKRREAIKNKYRGQATPLLVQALHLGTEPSSPASTPNPTESTSRKSASPAPSSPQTPRDSSGLQSPTDLSFSKDEDLANAEAGSPNEEGEEPSAADYDPTIDMQEERARHDRRLFKEDENSSMTADRKAIENVAKQLSPLRPASQPQKVKDEFDMFADEEDDMFAEAPVKPMDNIIPETKTAQALDANMMDDWDDSEGYYNTILGELIETRYHVTQNLGRGMFSSVVRAIDSATNQPVAIKIIRNNDTMRKAGIKEIDILKDIAANDPEDKKHVIRLHRSFDHKGHLCMVFENLSLNLREVLKKFGRDVGINLKAIRAYAQQLFLGLTLLRKCQYLHADLKPDNILVNEGRNMIKICDLGSASPITENVTAPYLVSRFYRAPEIILGMPYDYGIDMWSIGCTLFELYTGKILFTGRNNNAMLRSIMDCRGKFSHKLLRKGTFTYEYFDDLLNFQSLEQDKVTGRTIVRIIEVKAKPVRDLRSRLIPKGRRMEEQERKEVELFLDLLDRCLDLRPEKRIMPTEALKHPFILRAKP